MTDTKTVDPWHGCCPLCKRPRVEATEFTRGYPAFIGETSVDEVSDLVWAEHADIINTDGMVSCRVYFDD